MGTDASSPSTKEILIIGQSVVCTISQFARMYVSVSDIPLTVLLLYTLGGGTRGGVKIDISLNFGFAPPTLLYYSTFPILFFLLYGFLK